jgi:hypothetical protein
MGIVLTDCSQDPALHPIVLAVVTRPLVNSSSVTVVDIIALAKANNAYIHLGPLQEVSTS